MPKKKYIIDLTEDERNELQTLTSKGTLGARKLKRALILLKADEGLRDGQIVAALNVSRPTVGRVRKRFVEGGLPRALNEDTRPGARLKLDGRDEAQLVTLACSTPPAGHTRWTLRLLAEKLVKLEVVETISHETVRQRLKKTNLSRGNKSSGVFQRRMPNSSPAWKTCSTFTSARMTRNSRWCASMRVANS